MCLVLVIAVVGVFLSFLAPHITSEKVIEESLSLFVPLIFVVVAVDREM